ncbi:MAG: LysR family transcriptional regulator, partial [Candidatus Rokuibacteriota bacterium]
MELRHLRYFRAVAESKGFREAARRLHVVQPALSQTVSDLERELGVRLLTRNSRSVRLTSEGEVFLKEAKEILAHADRSVELARGARGEIGSLSVGFLGSATAFFLPRIIREFRHRFPGVRLTLREMAPTPQIDEFRAGRLDVGFTRPIPATDDAWLRSECLYRDSLLAVLPKGHPASTRPVVPVKQLAAEPFVLFHRAGAPELFDAIVSLCSRAGFTPRVVNEADMMQTVLTLVEAGEGVTLVPACVSNLRGNGVVLRPVEPDTVRIPLMMAWPEDRESRALRSFL